MSFGRGIAWAVGIWAILGIWAVGACGQGLSRMLYWADKDAGRIGFEDLMAFSGAWLEP